MKINNFSKILKLLFEERLNFLNSLIDQKNLKFNSPYSFNNLLRCVETPTHFISELLGSKRFKSTDRISVKPLQKKNEKISSTNSYFIPFSENKNKPVINICSNSNSLQSFMIITNNDYLKIKKLPFPIPSVSINREDGDSPINITDVTDLLILKDITLISISDFLYFYRYIPFAFITKKNVTQQIIKNRLDEDLQFDIDALKHRIPVKYITGINYYHPEPNIYFSNQLLSLSNQIIKEPYIDKYIDEHKSIFANTLGYKKVSKVSFTWVARSNEEPFEGKPDFVLIKCDDSFDILDIKTGAIKTKSLTKGKKLSKGQKIRIRFVDYVNELISQLEGYKSYFRYEKNIQFIENKYNLNVDLDNMKLIGIVGNQNNFDKGEVDSALMPFKDHIKIISYYDVANMALTRSTLTK